MCILADETEYLKIYAIGIYFYTQIIYNDDAKEASIKKRSLCVFIKQNAM